MAKAKDENWRWKRVHMVVVTLNYFTFNIRHPHFFHARQIEAWDIEQAGRAHILRYERESV